MVANVQLPWLARVLLTLSAGGLVSLYAQALPPVVPLPLPETSRFSSFSLQVDPLPPTQFRGMSVAHNYQQGGERGYGSPTSHATLVELKGLGVNWISLTPFGFMRGKSADQIQLATRAREGERDDRMKVDIAAAHALGLKVMLKPHLWIHHGVWCGEINPGSPIRWENWKQSYRQFILHYAEFSQATGVDILTIGVELKTVSTDEVFWRSLIHDIRQVYQGKLVYAANWDETSQVEFWADLDYVGVQLYAPLAPRGDELPDELALNLQNYLTSVVALSHQVNRPLLITEVGFTTARGSLQKPWLWPEHLSGASLDPLEQAAGYATLLQGLGHTPEVAGLFVWKWFTDPLTSEEGAGGFSPRGKPAEKLLQQAFTPSATRDP